MKHQQDYYVENVKRLLASNAPEAVRLVAAGRILQVAESGLLAAQLSRGLIQKLLPNQDFNQLIEWASFGDLDE